MNHSGNPAGRLYLFFKFVYDYETEGHEGRDTLAKLIEVYINGPEPDADLPTRASPEIYEAVASLWRLPDEAEAQIESLEAGVLPKSVLLRPIPTSRALMESFVNLDSQQTAVGMRQKTSEPFLHYLEVTSHHLSAAAQVMLQDEEALLGILKLADEILVLLDRSNLEFEYNNLVRSYVSGIAHATSAIRIYGPSNLVAERDRMVGMLLRRSDLVDAFKQDGTLTERIWLLLNKIVIVTGVTTFPLSIAADAAGLYAIAAGQAP